MDILNQATAGIAIPDLCREHGVSHATFYKWRAKYGGINASMISRLKELEVENQHLKKIYAEAQLKHFNSEAIKKSNKHSEMYRFNRNSALFEKFFQ